MRLRRVRLLVAGLLPVVAAIACQDEPTSPRRRAVPCGDTNPAGGPSLGCALVRGLVLDTLGLPRAVVQVQARSEMFDARALSPSDYANELGYYELLVYRSPTAPSNTGVDTVTLYVGAQSTSADDCVGGTCRVLVGSAIVLARFRPPGEFPDTIEVPLITVRR